MSVIDSLDKNMPILVVDDAPTMRRVVRNCLQQLGFHNITEAQNVGQALETLQRVPVQLVISDWNMSALPGQDLLRKVRSDAKLCSLPFLMVAPATQKVPQTAEDAGETSCFIAKPFTAHVLQTKMEHLFNSYYSKDRS